MGLASGNPPAGRATSKVVGAIVGCLTSASLGDVVGAGVHIAAIPTTTVASGGLSDVGVVALQKLAEELPKINWS